MAEQKKCNYWRCANAIGLFLVVLFAVCFFWYFIRPVEQGLHLKLFQMAYLGFDGMNFLSFVLGAIQTYVWAYIGLGLWQLVGCCFKAGSCDKK